MRKAATTTEETAATTATEAEGPANPPGLQGNPPTLVVEEFSAIALKPERPEQRQSTEARLATGLISTGTAMGWGANPTGGDKCALG